MFWRKKNSQEETVEKLEEFLRESREQFEDSFKKQNEEWLIQRAELQKWIEDSKDVLEEIGKKLPDWERTLRRQSDSAEDFMDVCEEHRKQELMIEKKMKEERESEEALVALVCFCREQMDLIAGSLEKDPVWKDQNHIIEQEAQKYLRAAQIQETGVCGEPVDYEIHQVLNVVETSRKELAGTVAEVYRRGRIWKGKVIRKSQVAAYRLEGEAK